MFNEILRFLQAVLTLIHIYWIGIVYAVKEWFFDYFTQKNQLILEKNFPEKKFLTKWDSLKKEVRQHNREVVKGGQKVAVLTGADGSIGIKVSIYI